MLKVLLARQDEQLLVAVEVGPTKQLPSGTIQRQRSSFHHGQQFHPYAYTIYKYLYLCMYECNVT